VQVSENKFGVPCPRGCVYDVLNPLQPGNCGFPYKL